jgi:hypothetical protein
MTASAADTKGVAWEVPDMVSPAAVIATPGASIVSMGALHTAQQAAVSSKPSSKVSQGMQLVWLQSPSALAL